MRRFALAFAFLLAAGDVARAFCGFYVARADSNLFNKASKLPSTEKAARDKYAEESLRLVRQAVQDGPRHEESDTWRMAAIQHLTRDTPDKSALAEARQLAGSANSERARKLAKDYLERFDQ